nr:bifunctional 4-hydroxy-3-methylbut-2-enyl diphosphate reductase/30S ribosomal protein S1 [Zhaonella formicivorans]
MQIIIAKNAGFCFGVRRALNLTEEANANSAEPLYTLGPLIHNRQVVERLKQKGVEALSGLEEVSGGRLVIRSHGVGPEVKKAAETKFKVIDATCPYVMKAQQLAAELTGQGYQIVILGDKMHPEVAGLLGWAEGRAVVVENAEEAQEISYQDKVALIAQTTQRPETLQAVENVLRGKIKDLVVFDTICRATKERQDATQSLAREVDVMIVIGGRNSANTNKLVSICRGTGTPTYHVEEASELQPQWFSNADKVGVTAGASTPDWIIEEVVQRMTDLNQEEIKTEGAIEEVDNNAGETSKDSAEFTLTAEMKTMHKGDILEGTVVQITDSGVMVDIGGKSEGIIPLAELSINNISNPSEVVKTGDKVQVMVLRVENEEGYPVLSKKRAERKLAWEKLSKAMTDNQEITAPVVEVVKGGVLVDVGVRGFVPASLLERGYVENLDVYLGRTLRLRVIEIDKEKNKVVLSQKAILDEEYEKQRQATWESLAVGQVRKGVVRRLTNFGAFVDLGGVDGLLHVSELAYGRVNHPKEVLSEGQEIEVKILDLDRDKGKVSLSLKDLLPNPWSNVPEKYPVGAVVNGKVLRIAPFGAFVELEPGVEGLVHISQLAHHHVAKVEDVVHVGDTVKVKILNIDQNAQKISLSVKEAEGAKKETPKEEPATQYQSSEANVTLGDVFGDLFGERKNGD